ncbi:MAG: sulfotransferase [Planctomycetes bacterium]|nr:sulfotransferase [Planctomycetota bacterium]
MSAEPTPIRWGNLRQWLRETREVDDRHYRVRARPLTAWRLLQNLVPAIGQPLFVVGAPRSGTSFLGEACGMLPEFSYHYEPPLTKAAARCVHEGWWSFPVARRFYRYAYWWLTRRRLAGDLRFAEKTPQNCFLIGFLKSAFPHAQFVHIIRDGRDAALSYRKKPWLRADSAGRRKRETGGYRYGPFARFWVEAERREEFERTSDLHRCVWAWRRHVENAIEQGGRLQADSYHELRYEALAADPRAEALRLLDFLGIEAAASRAAFSAYLEQARSHSVGRWRTELTPDEVAAIQAEAGTLLARLGYLGAGAELSR